MVLLAHPTFGQSDSLSLSSGTAAINGTVGLNLSLTSPAGSQPAAVQWTLTFSPSAVTSISASAGAAATSAGKTLNCVAGTGTYTCLATGMNANLIANGVVAIVNVTIASGVSSTAINVANVSVVGATGGMIASSGTGGTIIGAVIPPILTSLTCVPSTINTPGTAICTALLNAAALSGGALITLSDNSANLAVPASITIPLGATSATFTATALSVTSNQNAIVTASFGGTPLSATIVLNAALTYTVSSLQCSPTTLASNASSTCTVRISNAAPAGGLTVALSDDSTVLSVPASVNVPATSTSATFTATAGAISANSTANVTATLNSTSASAAISLTAPAISVSSLVCSPTTLASNASSTCTVRISSAAPTGGMTVVTLSDNSPALSVPASVNVAAASTSATFTATAGTISANSTANVTATLNSTSATAAISLTAPGISISSLACSPTTLASNATSTCTVKLSSAAPTGGMTVVALSDNSPALSVPASVNVPASTTSATFTATAGTMTTNQMANVTASVNGTSASAAISLTAPAISVSSLVCSPTSLASNATSTCTVTISSAAPTGGLVVVALSDNSPALSVPASVNVPATSTSATFTATAGAISANSTANITASLNNTSKVMAISLVSPVTGTVSIFSPTAQPKILSDSDTQSVELGMKFTSSQAGTVKGVRFYKGSQNKGTHTGHLWSTSGTLLASVTFSNETASGWQQANFASPVAVVANTVYVVSYHVAAGHYSADNGYFASGVTNGPLTALRDGQSGANGVYRYSSGTAFPNSTWQSSNYWVDVVFQPSSTGGSENTMMPETAAMSRTRTPSGQKADTSSLSCSPRAVQPGGTFNCEFQAVDASQPAELTTDGSDNIMLPDTAAARLNQHSLSFRGSVDENASQGSVTISAIHGSRRVNDTIVTLSSAAPVVTIPPDQLIQYGTAVGFKVSVSSADPAVLSATDLPPGASFDSAAGRFDWIPKSTQQGAYDVKFTAKGNAGTSIKTVHIEVGDGTPAISDASQFACSPGAIGTLSGKWLGPDSQLNDPSGTSTELAGTSVRINGATVPLLSAGKTRASFLCPDGQPGDMLQVVLATPAGTTAALQSAMRTASPVLLAEEDSNQGLIFQTGTAELATARDVRGAGSPAQPGDSISIRSTGIGTGIPVFVKIGGAYANVVSTKSITGAAGIREIQVTIPVGPEFGDAVPVQLEVASPDGQQLQSNTVTIAIERARR